MVERNKKSKGAGSDLLKIGLGLLAGAVIGFLGSKLIENAENSSEPSDSDKAKQKA